MVAARNKRNPEPEPEPTPPQDELEPDEESDLQEEPCISALFSLAVKMEQVGDKCLDALQFQYAIGAYNSAVQTLVTAHQLNDQLAARQAYFEAQQMQIQQTQESAPSSRNKRDFPFMEGEQR